MVFVADFVPLSTHSLSTDFYVFSTIYGNLLLKIGIAAYRRKTDELEIRGLEQTISYSMSKLSSWTTTRSSLVRVFSHNSLECYLEFCFRACECNLPN